MRRSTVLLVLIFVVLLGIYFFLNNRSKTAEVEATPEPTFEPIKYLFASTDGLPTLIRIESKAGDVVEVARNAENVWVMIQPDEAATDQGMVEAAASQVTTMRILERVPGLTPETVGLEEPEHTMSFQFTSGVERMIEIGVLTPTERGYYVRGEDNEILIVNNSAVDALLGLLTHPPYLPTEIPPQATP